MAYLDAAHTILKQASAPLLSAGGRTRAWPDEAERKQAAVGRPPKVW